MSNEELINQFNSDVIVEVENDFLLNVRECL